MRWLASRKAVRALTVEAMTARKDNEAKAALLKSSVTRLAQEPATKWVAFASGVVTGLIGRRSGVTKNVATAVIRSSSVALQLAQLFQNNSRSRLEKKRE